MSKLTTLSLLLLFIYITIAAEIAPGPAADDDVAAADLSPAPSPIDKYLNRCVKKFTVKCGPQLFGGVFLNVAVTEPCCKNLVYAGKQCHDVLVKRVYNARIQTMASGNEGVAKEYVSRTLSRSEKVWDNCVKLGVAPGRIILPRVRWLP